MNKCPYCGLEPRDDYPVEFRCGSVTNRTRSRACLVREVGQLRDRVADRERERDHANLVADAAMRENESLVDRVKRLEEALEQGVGASYAKTFIQLYVLNEEPNP